MNIIQFSARQPLTRTKMNYIHYKISDEIESKTHQNWEETGA
jgi:hypothetical protein